MKATKHHQAGGEGEGGVRETETYEILFKMHMHNKTPKQSKVNAKKTDGLNVWEMS